MDKKKRLDQLKIAGITLAVLVLCVYTFRKLSMAPEATVVFNRLMIGCMILGAVGVLTASILMVRKQLPLHQVYPVLGITLGIIFMLMIPTDMTPDEIAHFDSAYSLSSSIIRMEGNDNPWGLFLKRSCDLQYEEHKLSIENYGKYYATFEGSPDESLEVSKNDATEIRLPYIIGAIGISLGRLLHLNYGWVTVLGTMCQLLFFVAVVTYSLKKIPYGKRILFVVALLPMTLQQVSSFSYDNMMIACGILVTSLFLYWYSLPAVTESNEHKAIGRRMVEVLLYLMAALMLVKTKGGAYAVLLLLPLLLLLKRKKEIVQAVRLDRKAQICVAAVLLLITAGVIYVVASGRVQGFYANLCVAHEFKGSEEAALAPITMFTQPVFTMKRLALTAIYNGKDYLFTMVGGLLGWLQIVISGKIIWTILLVLILSMVKTRAEQELRIDGHVRAALVILAVLGSLLCIVAMMYYWTPASAMVVEGVQGRYFLPVLPALLIGLGMWKKPVWPMEYVDDYFTIAIAFLDYLVVASVLLTFI